MTKQVLYQKVLFAGDFHFPDQDPTALEVLLAFKKDFKPNYVCLGGDIVDADALSVHVGKKRSLASQIEQTRNFLDEIKPTHYLEGNHEQRCNREGVIPSGLEELVSIRKLLDIDKRKIKWAPYDNNPNVGSFKFGNLLAVHGFYTGDYPAAQHARAYCCPVVHFHCHRDQLYQPKSAVSSFTGFSLGCMCKLNLDYQKTGAQRGWTQSFGFAYVYPSGYFNFYHARLIGDDFVINGKHYARRITRNVNGRKQNEVSFA